MTILETIDYIHESLKTGQQKVEVAKALIAKGLSVLQINESFAIVEGAVLPTNSDVPEQSSVSSSPK